MSKTCTKCHLTQPLKNFPINKTGKGGLNPSCRACKRLERLSSPGQGTGRNLARYWPDATPAQAIENYRTLVAEQNNKCGICLNQESLIDHRTHEVRRLAVDHDHKTKRVRGLLCHHCNTAIGKFKDNINYLLKAIDYLKKKEFTLRITSEGITVIGEE